MAVAHAGRKPGATLQIGGRETPVRDAGLDLCARMADVCGLLDDAHQCADYTAALDAHRAMFADPEQTPSAVMLAEMRARRESYIEFAERKSREFHDLHLQRGVSGEQERAFDQLAEDSLRRQAEKENADRVSLDDYIAAYFAKLGEIDGE